MMLEGLRGPLPCAVGPHGSSEHLLTKAVLLGTQGPVPRLLYFPVKLVSPSS